MWNLEDRNHVSLVSALQIKLLHCVNPDLYLFDFGVCSTIRWKLAITNATDALYVYRLDASFNEYEIARQLIQQGIWFHTLLPLKAIPRSPTSPTSLLPIRLPDYRFTLNDYKTYQQQCLAILCEDRARAALLRGGIVWRLVVESLSFDDTLQGPSVSATVHQKGLSVTDPRTGDILGDDDLSQLELDMICGVYQCYTGKLYRL
jgi:hypothetical protein